MSALPSDAPQAGVMERLEELFSQIYLKTSEDQYFTERISESGELRIDDICAAPKVLEITTDPDAIKAALYKSKSLRVCSETSVKSSSAKPEQNTLILRDIAKSTPSGDILQIFTNAVSVDGTLCPAAQSVRSDMNDTWFVTFRSESDAKNALHAIRGSKFEGKPVLARLKTESTHKSFYSAPNSASAGNNAKGAGNFSPHNRNPNMGAPSPTSGPGSAAPSPTGAQANGAFFGAYPVPPPHFVPPAGAPRQAGLAPPQGPPSAYANMMIGPDGKPGFPGMPDLQQQQQQAQMMYAAQHQQHPQAFMDMQMGMFHGQQPGGYAPYNNNNRNRFGRNQNGYQNNQNYNQQGGGYNRSPTGQFRGNMGARGGGGNRNNFANQAGGAAHAPQSFSNAASGPTEVVPGSDGSPRSSASSGVVEGSVSEPAALSAPTPAAASESGGSEPGAQGAGSVGAPVPGQPVPLAINTAGPMHGQAPGPFMNFGAPGTPPFFPNYAFNGMPMQYQGFPGMMPPMSPMNFPGQMPPQGFYPMQMGAPMHGMPPHGGFVQQNAPPPRSSGDNNDAGGNRPKIASGQTNAPRNGGNGAGHQQQGARQNNNRGTAQAATEGGEEVVPAGAGAGAEKKTSNTSAGAGKGSNRDRRAGNAGAEGAGSKSSSKPAAADSAEAVNGNRHRTNSTNSEGTARRGGASGGAGAGAVDSRERKVGEKGGDRGGAGDKKKFGREKGRDGAGAKKTETAAPVPPKRAVEFNMEADFPILIDSEAGPSVSTNNAPKAAVFDYANAAKKASQPLYNSPPLEAAPAAAPAPADAAKGPKAGKKNAEKKSAGESAVVPEVHAVAETVPAVAAPVPAAAAAAVQEAPVAAAPVATPVVTKQRLPSPEPAVESFTFGSVVAPVVNPADRSVLHFGSQTAAAVTHHAAPAEKAASAACPSSSSANAHFGEKAAASAPPAAPVASPSVAAVAATPQHDAAPQVVAEAAKPAAWGAKKSFADVLLRSGKA